jgi:hypothetical protein
MSKLSPQMLKAAFEALYPQEKRIPCQRPMLEIMTIAVVDDNFPPFPCPHTHAASSAAEKKLT